MGNRRESLGRNRKMSSPINTNLGFVVLMVVFGVATWQAAKWLMAAERTFGAKELKCPFYKITYERFGPTTVIQGCGRKIAVECTKKKCVENPNGGLSAPGDVIIQ
jgi:hypothetical protein